MFVDQRKIIKILKLLRKHYGDDQDLLDLFDVMRLDFDLMELVRSGVDPKAAECLRPLSHLVVRKYYTPEQLEKAKKE